MVDKDDVKREVLELRVPQFGEGIHEVEIIGIRKLPGETVKQDEVLYELETSKSIFEIESEVEGEVIEWLVQAGDVVQVGTVVARIAVGSGIQAQKENDTLPASVKAQPQTAQTAQTTACDPHEVLSELPLRAAEKSASTMELRVPQFGEGIHEVEIIGIRKLPGETVKQDEVLYELETSKSIFEIESEVEGEVIEWLVQAGDVVQVGTIVARLAVGSGIQAQKENNVSSETSRVEPQALTETSRSDSQTVRPAARHSYFIPPRTRAYAREKNLERSDLLKIVPRGHKVMPADVDKFIAAQKTKQSAGTREISQAQRKQNQHFARSKESLVTATVVSVAPYNNALKCLRYEFNRSYSAGTSSLVTFVQLIAFYIAQTAGELEKFRSMFVDLNTYSVAEDLNMGIAVETNGLDLVTAVVEKANGLSFSQFVEKMNSAVDLARGGKDQAAKKPQIIVSYLGSEGIFHGSPLLVSPSIATIAVGAVETIGLSEPRFSLSMTFDHRIITGMDASRFLQEVLKRLQLNAERMDAASAASVPEDGNHPTAAEAYAPAASEGSGHAAIGQKDKEAAGSQAEGTVRAGATAARQPLASPRHRSVDAVVRQLKKAFAGLGNVDMAKIDANQPLGLYGLDSLVFTQLHRKLSDVFGDLPPTLFYEHPTLAAVSAYLLHGHAGACDEWLGMRLSEEPVIEQEHGHETDSAPMKRIVQAGEPIAIIGLGARYSHARTIAEFWENLSSGRDCIEEIPAERWRLDGFFDPDIQEAASRQKSYCKWGSFISGVDEFDPLFFNVSPREAKTMDPQERLFLETVWTTIEDAGYTRESLNRQCENRVGVYVGAMFQHYEAGSAGVATVANRVSHFFDFEGPSIAVETMCSSSAMAIHMACQSILSGECDAAVAGGVNVAIHPAKYTWLCGMQLLGSHAGSRSFTDGDGYLPAEGVGAVLLKPYSKALADGDKIYAVIKASATKHSGRSNGYTVPNPNQQARTMEACLAKAGVTADSISYVEAAANGSALADSIEIAALNMVFGRKRSEQASCMIGSVKSNLGNPEFASGIAQLSKVALQLHHRKVVPTVMAGPMNPKLRLEDSVFSISGDLKDWSESLSDSGKQDNISPRRGLINSFGAGGTYVCLLLEEHAPQAAHQHVEKPLDNQEQLIVLSAKTADRLEVMAEQLLDFVKQGPSSSMSALAYTLQLRREAMETRLAIIARTWADLEQTLAAYLATRRGENTAHAAALFAGNADEGPAHLRSLFAGRSGETFVHSMLEERDLEKLALFWTQGGTVPWERLHAAPAPHVAVPGYPFLKQRYWVESAKWVGNTKTAAACIEPTGTSATSTASHASVEDVLCEKLGTMLELPQAEVPRQRPMRALGFTSIDAMQLKHWLEERFGKKIELELIGRGDSTVQQLAKNLSDVVGVNAGELSLVWKKSGDAASAPIVPQIRYSPEDRHLPFPLSDIQESFIAGRMMNTSEDRVGAHIYLELEIQGELDIYRLNSAWQRLVERHDILRTVFSVNHQQTLPRVRHSKFKLVDLRRLHHGERITKFNALRSEAESRIYAYDAWPLFDICISLHPEKRYVVHFSIDELIVDGMSVDILLREWSQLYTEPDRQLPELTLSFRDYLLAMKAFEDSARCASDISYWMETLCDMPSGPALPTREHPSDFSRVRLAEVLNEAQWSALKEKADEFNVTPTSLILAAFAETLKQCSQHAAFTLLLTLANRPPIHPQIGEMVGSAISTSLFVVEPQADDDFAAIARAHQTRLWRNLDHSSASAIRILRELKARRMVSGTMTLPVVFTSMLSNGDASADERVLGHVVYMVNQTPQVYLDHQVKERSGKLLISWDVAEGYYAEGVVRALFTFYVDVLRGLADQRLPWNSSTFSPPENLLCKFVSGGKQEQSGVAPVFTLVRSEEDEYRSFPLSDQQQAYAFGRGQNLDDGGGSSQLYREIELQKLDVRRLEEAWGNVLQIHPMLRTVIGADGTQALMANLPRYEIAVADLRRQPAHTQEAARSEICKSMMNRIAPLDQWPYFEIRVSLLDEERACIHVCTDLMIADGASFSLVIEQLLHCYAQPNERLRSPEVSFRDYQISVDRFKGSRAYEKSMAYWLDKFAVLPSGPALSDAHVKQHQGAADHQRLSQMFRGWGDLKEKAVLLGLSPGAVLLAVYLEVLFLWNRREPFSVVVPGWERLPVHPGINDVVGDFTAMSWIARTAETMGFIDRVRDVQRQLAADLEQRPVSGLLALRRVARKDRSRALTFPVVFTDRCRQIALPTNDVVLGKWFTKTAQVRLDCMSEESEEGLACAWDFAGEAYAAEAMNAMFAGQMRLLELLSSDMNAWFSADPAAMARLNEAIPGTAQRQQADAI